jgi:hypothetical protein
MREAARWDFRREWWRIALRLSGIVAVGVYLVVVVLVALLSPLFAWFS